MKKIFYLFVLILFVSCKERKKNFQSDETILNKKYKSLSDTKKLKYLDSITKQVYAQKNDSIKTKKLFEIADEYFNLNDKNNLIKISNNIYQKAVKDKDSTAIGKALYHKGYYFHNNLKDSAYYYFKESEKIFRLTKNYEELVKVHYYKSDVLFYEGLITMSEVETFKALKFLKTVENPDLEYKCNTNQGFNHLDLGEFDKALYYFKQAGIALEKLKKSDKYYIYSVINTADIADVYHEKGQYDKAVAELKKITTKKLKAQFSDYYATNINNIAYSLMKAKKYDEAKKYFDESLKISKEINDDQKKLFKIIDYGEFCLLTKDTLNAKKYLNNVYLLSKRLKSGKELLKSLDFLSQIDKTKALFYKNEYIRINDSITKKLRANRDKFERIEYETDRIEEENHLLTKQNSNILGVSIVLLLLSSILFIIFRLKSKNKELQLIQEQQQANEKIYELMLSQQSEKQSARNEERNRIAMELHDGIVNSIFTTRFNLKQLNPDQTDKKEQLVKELENVEKEIRRVSHNLQQNILFEDTNLIDLISNLVASQQNDSNTKFDLTVDKFIDWSLISGNDKIHVYRIIQEALQNVNKYSKAEKCFVFLLKTADKITIRIWDNGIGFDIQRAKQGIGLKNIEQRTKSLKGELKIIPTLGKGCTIEVIF